MILLIDVEPLKENWTQNALNIKTILVFFVLAPNFPANNRIKSCLKKKKKKKKKKKRKLLYFLFGILNNNIPLLFTIDYFCANEEK